MTPTALPRNFSISNLLSLKDQGPLPLRCFCSVCKKHTNGGLPPGRTPIRPIGSLQAELDAVEQATTELIREMEEAIAEAGRFIDAAG
jgi:hypothetical protein